jgi:hypothetical protein
LGAQSEPLAIIEVLDPKKTSFRPSKWPRKFRNRKTAKNSKLPENCFEPVGIGGWPPISTCFGNGFFGRFTISHLIQNGHKYFDLIMSEHHHTYL